MKLNVPSEEEIKLSLSKLFDKVFLEEKEWLLSCLVPIDNTLVESHKIITYVIEDEMRELCDF